MRYAGIRAWGEMMGSQDYYISDECRKAEEDGAPDDAIYKGRDPGLNERERWHTISEIRNEETRRRIQTRYDQLKDL